MQAYLYERTLKMSEATLKKKSVDMTEGNIVKHIVLFALPLLIGNIFQQLYNMVDTWVVGNFVSNEAFSAVGTVGPITNMIIGIFMGFSSGAGAVISQNFGAKQYDKVKKTVHTSMVVTVILCVVFTLLGVLMTPLMVTLIKHNDDVKVHSIPYLTIYFAGVSGLLIYNIGSAILRAIGDSKRPFYFLVASAITNIVLDFALVFAIPSDLRATYGSWAVAFATIISQGVSAALTLIALFKSDTCIKLSMKEMKLDFDILKKIVSIGFPAALQMAITSFSNVFVMSYINALGTNYSSGWSAYSKIDQLMFLPMQSLALAATTFVAQNLGRGFEERAKKGISRTVFIAVVSTVILMIPVIALAPYLVAFFNQTPEVIEAGSLFLTWITPFYICCCFNQVYAGALRGAGNSRAPMIIMIISFVVIRQIYLFVVSNYISNDPLAIGMSYPAGWLVCCTSMYTYYKRTSLLKHRVVDGEAEKERV